MRMLAVGLVVATMLLAGCAGYSELAETPVNSTPAAPEETIVPEEPTVPEELTSDSNTSPSVVLPNEPPADRTWISPGKVNIGNFYPGARAEYPITVHNGKDTVASFLVTYRYPDHVGEGYVKPTLEVQDWITIANSTPILMPQETRDILVTLAMPKGATSPAQEWEFWVSVTDASQTGMVQTELAVRWIISMRN